jgi:hypothetical protein
MIRLVIRLLQSLRSCVGTRAEMQVEILALRHQLNVLRRSVTAPSCILVIVGYGFCYHVFGAIGVPRLLS